MASSSRILRNSVVNDYAYQQPARAITGTIDVADPEAFGSAACAISWCCYRDYNFTITDQLHRDFGVHYRGELPGFLACDTRYQDIQHVPDVSLAMARLVDGYESTTGPGSSQVLSWTVSPRVNSKTLANRLFSHQRGSC